MLQAPTKKRREKCNFCSERSTFHSYTKTEICQTLTSVISLRYFTIPPIPPQKMHCLVFVLLTLIIARGGGIIHNDLQRIASYVIKRGGNLFQQPRAFERDQPIFPNPSPIIPVNQRKLCGIRVDIQGNLNEFEISKQQFANSLQLPLRDLRIVDPSYPNQIQATVVARQNVILFSIDNIKMIIKKDEAFIFNTNHSDAKYLLPLLQQQLNQLRSSDKDPLGLPTEKGEESVINSSMYFSSQQSFGQVVLETALNIICVNLASSVRSLEPSIAAALLDLREISKGLDVIQTQVDELLPLKNKIDEIRKRCQEIKRCMIDLLHSDEDLELMTLSSSPISINEEMNAAEEAPLNGYLKKEARKRTSRVSDISHRNEILSIELLLENYLNEVEWITSEVDDILDEIINTEENVVLQLDLIRNRILKFELFLSISSFVVTCGALITGLFGMNLLNHFELDRKMFYVVSGLLFMGMAVSFRRLISFAKHRKLL